MKHLTILLSLITILASNADDILVNTSGLQGTYTTISDAVEAANPGDRILIAPQPFPYQEDTLFIDKNLTLMPAATNSFVDFDGSILLTLDSINSFTLIGFRSNNLFESIAGVINDESVNTYSIINIIDTGCNTISLDLPKTSLYLSYSDIEQVSFAHGDIIGNAISRLYFGLFNYADYDAEGAYTYYDIYNTQQDFWPYENGIYNASGSNFNNGYVNYIGHEAFLSECDLFDGIIPFGNVNTYSDTCNIIANVIGGDSYGGGVGQFIFNLFNVDFPFNISNNSICGRTAIYLAAPESKGSNSIVNNYMSENIHYMLAYCPGTDSFNFFEPIINQLNNNGDSRPNVRYPYLGANAYEDASLLSTQTKSMVSYNDDPGCYVNDGPDQNIAEVLFQIGPAATTAYPNPSLDYLNLDLTPNIPGVNGGSNAWINYHGVEAWNSCPPMNNMGFMPEGSKARVTYLNLPTQILDPSTNINIKAKSVHGN